MGMAEKIRIMLVKRGNISGAELARRLNTTPQNLSKKLRRDDFSESDLRKIAEVLDCTLEIGFRMNDTNEIV